MENNNYTDKKNWDKYYKSYTTNKPTPFSDIFNKYLKIDASKKVLEIGCAGGNFLYYIYNNFQYQPYGIDYSDSIELTRKKFLENNAPLPKLYQEDFLKWDTQEKFDLVFSIGFIEHFSNPENIIKKHVDLLNPNGMIIITVPHFAHGQYFLHWLLDRDNLKLHNTKIMNLKFFKDTFKNLPVNILHLSYDSTFAFWTEKKNLNILEKILYRSIRKFGKIIVSIIGDKHPNFLFSPSIVCVVQKNN